MTQRQTIEFLSAPLTMQYATAIGKKLKGGEVIELVGDVGAGKTTFVKGLVQGIQSEDIVSSPTFTISNVYDGRVAVHHYDLYRLHNDELIDDQLNELLNDSKSVVVLEWADEVQGVLPPERLRVEFEVINEEGRKLTFVIPEQYAHLEIV